jgi:hypothetical protein
VEQTLRRYIDHRLDRERQIVAALADRPRTVDELVALMYPLIHTQLYAAARDSLVAHLLKLQEEARVSETESVWSLKRDDRPSGA